MTIRNPSLTITDENNNKHKIDFSFKHSDGGKRGDDLDYPGHLILNGRVSIPRQRTLLCQYHLEKMKTNLLNEFLVKSSIEAIASNLRTVTFTLQAECNKSKKFNKWYAIKVEEMKKIPQLKEMIDLRNKVEKVGHDLISFGPVVGVYRHLDGTISGKLLPPIIQYGTFKFTDVYVELAKVIDYFVLLVEEAHEHGFLSSEPKPVQFRQIHFKEDSVGGFYEVNITE